MVRRPFVFLALLFSFVGCSEAFEKTDMIPIKEVPEAVMKVAKEKLPNVNFDTAWTEKEAGKTVYEIRGKTNDGKTRDIKISPDGTVLEVD